MITNHTKRMTWRSRIIIFLVLFFSGWLFATWTGEDRKSLPVSAQEVTEMRWRPEKIIYFDPNDQISIELDNVTIDGRKFIAKDLTHTQEVEWDVSTPNFKLKNVRFVEPNDCIEFAEIEIAQEVELIKAQLTPEYYEYIAKRDGLNQ